MEEDAEEDRIGWEEPHVHTFATRRPISSARDELLVTINYILRWVQARPTKGRPGSEAGSSSTDEPIYLLL